MTSFILYATSIFVSLFMSSALAQQKLPVKQLTAGLFVIKAEVANTEAQRELGLMNRTEMGQNEGMLFVFDRPAGYCMWMKNTFIPLSVAFLDSEGVIINIEEMYPQNEKNHCATKPALYALEMNAGWFQGKNIKPGGKIEMMK